MNTEVLLQSTGNGVQYPVLNQKGKQYEKVRMCITESLCRVAQVKLCSPSPARGSTEWDWEARARTDIVLDCEALFIEHLLHVRTELAPLTYTVWFHPRSGSPVL